MGLLKRIVSQFFADDAMTHAAALAYYGALSLAPLLLILLWLASLVGPQAESALVDQAIAAVGEEAGGSVRSVIANAQQRPTLASISGIIGLGVLLFSAASVFVQLQHALNKIWEVEARPDAGIWNTIRKRLLSFAIVLLMGVLLLASLVVGSVLSVGFDWFGASAGFYRILNEAIIFAVLAAFLALIFKYLPDVRISWRDVLWGAIVTAVLLTAGKFLIGLYLGRSSVGSSYGAAASVVLLLVWAYYSSIILLFGAEFTQVWARRSGRQITPDAHAQPVQVDKSAPQPKSARTAPPETEKARPDRGRNGVRVTTPALAPPRRPVRLSPQRGPARTEQAPGRLLLTTLLLIPLVIAAALLRREGGDEGTHRPSE